jgi:hypothetical protein
MDIHRLRSLLYQITHTGGELCRDVPVSSAHLSLMLAACPPSTFLTRLENRIEKRRKLLYSSSRMNTIQAAHTHYSVCVYQRGVGVEIRGSNIPVAGRAGSLGPRSSVSTAEGTPSRLAFHHKRMSSISRNRLNNATQHPYTALVPFFLSRSSTRHKRPN